MDEREVAVEKAAARERFRALRAALIASVRAGASEAITRHVLALHEVAAARTVLAYWPLVARGEVDVRSLIRRLEAEGCVVALPAVGPDGLLTPRRFASERDLVAGPFGTREPPASAPLVPSAEIEVVVVPGLAMGRDGSRLGYGGGYYDRFLVTTPAFRLGVVWEGALVDALPADADDARLDAVVTERGVLRPEAARRNPTDPQT